tara:strand:- start:91 stop:411 length:321 start_codon:yes stop_codon:yes gene_type:complete
MTLPKISIETIAATAAQATRQDVDTFAVSSMLELVQEQPELTNLISECVASMISGAETLRAEGVEEVPIDFAQDAIIKAAFATYGLVIAAVKAQVEADELNEAWGK